jgi:peroxiredoxin
LKKAIFYFCLIIAVASCKPRPEGVEISGVFTNSQKEKVLLEELGMQQSTPIDSTIIGDDGEFKIVSKVSGKGFYRLSLNQNNFVILILDSGETIRLTGDAQNLAETYTVEGSRDSEKLWELNNFLKQNYRQRDSIQQVFQEYMYHPDRDSIGKALETEFEESIAELRQYIKSFIENNPESFATLAAIEQLNPDTDFEYFRMVVNNLSERYPESPYVKALNNRIREMERTAIGSPAPEITMKTPDGNILSLSELRGQVVLIDFWASWCRPCRVENPNVVRMYQKYRPKGFEILGVSLDREHSAWVNAIKEDNLTWKHISDLQFWDSPVVKQYGFSGIPYTVLVDREGKIIAKGLRGPELEQKLEDVLN